MTHKFRACIAYSSKFISQYHVIQLTCSPSSRGFDVLSWPQWTPTHINKDVFLNLNCLRFNDITAIWQ